MKKYPLRYSIPLGITSVFIVLWICIAYLLPLTLPSVPTSTVILDRSGAEIGEVPYEQRIRHRAVTIGDIPEFTRAATVALEDRTFYTNP